LKRRQLQRLPGAITDQVMFAETQNGADHRLPVGGDTVQHGVRHPQHRHGGRGDFIPLIAPFRGDGFGQGAAGHGEKIAAGGAHRLAIQQNAKAFTAVFDGGVFIEAFHLRLGFGLVLVFGNGSRGSLTSKPSSSQLFNMCGGRGAVT